MDRNYNLLYWIVKNYFILSWYFSKADGSFTKIGKALIWYGLDTADIGKLIKQFDVTSVGSSLSSAIDREVFSAATQESGFHTSSRRDMPSTASNTTRLLERVRRTKKSQVGLVGPDALLGKT
ncbi:hypothetical protein JCM33374_g1584 [Metschnikowia sp. JCM 33374]|nr:hypothetical protein JCM33374_g1584 [Metschnikowia sp. JCM 33374]